MKNTLEHKVLKELYEEHNWPNIEYSINGSFIEIKENIPNLIPDTYYLILNKTTNYVEENDLLLKLYFVEYDKVTNFPLFKIPNQKFVYKVNSKLTLINQVDETDYPFAIFMNDSGYSIINDYRDDVEYYKGVADSKSYFSFPEIKDYDTKYFV